MASKGVNRVILIGNCGKDPETKTFANGGSITSVSLATSDSYKDKSGNEVDRTEWHNLVFNNQRLGEVVQRYVRKGSKIYVEGSIRTRKWQDKDGRDRYTTEIICSDMQMLDGASQGDSAGSDFGSSRPSASVSRFPARSGAAAPAPAYAGGDDPEDPIPF